MEMELLYTYLYATSIIILLVFVTPSLLTQNLVKHFISLSFAISIFSLKIYTQRDRLGFKRRERAGMMVSNIALVMTFFLGIFSVVYCIVEFLVFTKAFPETEMFADVKINSFLAAFTIFLEIAFVYQFRWNDQFCWRKMPKFLSGLHRLAKIHLMITNIAVWLKILTKETVVYTLEYHEVTNSSTVVNTKYSHKQINLAIPNFGDPCEAYKCFSHRNMTCPTKNTLWTMEQGFSCEKTYYNHFGTNFYPFFNEFCLLMACVFYEMFGTEDPDEDVNVREGQDSATAPAQEGKLLVCTKNRKTTNTFHQKLYHQVQRTISCGKVLISALAFL